MHHYNWCGSAWGLARGKGEGHGQHGEDTVHTLYLLDETRRYHGRLRIPNTIHSGSTSHLLYKLEHILPI